MHAAVQAYGPKHEYFYQLYLLSDQARIAAYRKALSELVTPGDIVAELGCGSGVLGRLALESGAGTVYAIDYSADNIELARGLNAMYFPNASIEYLNADARALVLPQKVDLVVSEFIGVLGDDEDMSGILSAFCPANLRPGGKVCPLGLDVFAAVCLWRPVRELQVPEEFKKPLPQPRENELGFYLETDWNTIQILQEPQRILSVDGFGEREEGCGWSITAADVVDPFNAIAVWFQAQLSPSAVLDTGPKGVRTHWCISVAELPQQTVETRKDGLFRLRMETDEQLMTRVFLEV